MILVTHLLITATVTLTTNQLPPACSAKNRASPRFLYSRESSVSQGSKKTHVMPLSLLPKHFTILYIVYEHHTLLYYNIYSIHTARNKDQDVGWLKLDNINYQRTNLNY